MVASHTTGSYEIFVNMRTQQNVTIMAHDTLQDFITIIWLGPQPRYSGRGTDRRHVAGSTPEPGDLCRMSLPHLSPPFLSLYSCPIK